MIPLPNVFLTTPFAHRGLHDVLDGRPENSLAAARAAIASGYGIELDVQASCDQAAMVFHDYDMARLAGQPGAIQTRNLADLVRIGLIGNDEPVPTLATFLAEVGGKVPLLIEIKDQDGAMGPNIGPLEQAVAAELRNYDGPVAVMSFNPHSVAAMAEYAPDIPRGLVTQNWCDNNTSIIPLARRRELSKIADLDLIGVSFVSHDAIDLNEPRIAELKRDGVPILTWTIRSPAEEACARQIADNITFENYRPSFPDA